MRPISKERDVDREIRGRTRRALLARHAVSPKLRSKYYRAVHAIRVTRESQSQRDTSPPTAYRISALSPPGFTYSPSGSPSDHVRVLRSRRRLPCWALICACLPVLLLSGVGGYSVITITHAEQAVNRVSAPSVADQLRENPAPPVSAVVLPGSDLSLPTLQPLPRPPTLSSPVPQPSFNRKDVFTVMLLGVEDQRNSADDPSRSDTIILAYVDPVAKHVNLISIPRDLQVSQADGSGPAKIADVFAHGDAIHYKGVGGLGLVWDTVQNTFHIRIDYFVRVNFTGFQRIIETIGGVTVDNPYPIKDDEYPTEDYQYTRIFFPAGIMHLNGDEALQYARTRHSDNDYGRNVRQQQIILAIREQAQKTDLFSKANSLLDSLGDAFRTDLPSDQWLGFAYFAKGLSNADIQRFALTDLLFDNPQHGIYYSGIDLPKAIARMKEFSPKENSEYLNSVKR